MRGRLTRGIPCMQVYMCLTLRGPQASISSLTISCVNASFRARTEVITPVDLNQLRYHVNRIALD